MCIHKTFISSYGKILFMNTKRNVLIILNCIVSFVIILVFYEEGLPPLKIDIRTTLYLIFLTAILNILFFIKEQNSNKEENSNKKKNENLLSLWLKLKKKKLKDELEE